MSDNFAFVIPAYNPDNNLLIVVNNILSKNLHHKIFIIDDGSKDNYQHIFEKLNNDYYKEDIVLIRHAVNLGKGAALKTVFNKILTEYIDIQGVVTLDCDGQHSIDDCLQVLIELEKNEKAFVLGCRNFSRDIPLKSYIGNNISRFIYKILLGRSFQDTQTGLRGINREFMRLCLTIKTNRFEFETEQLAIACRMIGLVDIVEIPITTIYLDSNKLTSFRPLVDSFKIYFVLFRYGLSSIITTLVDFIIFLMATYLGSGILLANLLARTASIGVQFNLLNKMVFQTNASIGKFFLFIIYVYIMGVFSSFTQSSITETFSISIISSKIIVETILFFVNFVFLRLFIFTLGESISDEANIENN